MCGFEPVPTRPPPRPLASTEGPPISSERAFAGGGLCRKANGVLFGSTLSMFARWLHCEGGGGQKSGAVDRLTDRWTGGQTGAGQGKKDSQPAPGRTGTGAGLVLGRARHARPRHGATLDVERLLLCKLHGRKGGVWLEGSPREQDAR